MKAESKNLKLTGTNSYLVWVSNYYRERSNGKEVRIILFGDVFHVYFVEYDKENKEFNIELVHHFSRKYGEKVEPVRGSKQLLLQEYEYGKNLVHQLNGGYSEKDFDFEKSNLDVVIETALQTI
tara:strand:+ start:337 stop:708 length:372 start_codon:yes stop_codon:yes gene_type:complete